MNFEKIFNFGKEKEKNLEEINENEVENKDENKAKKEVSMEQVESVKENIKELEVMALEFENFSQEDVQRKYESSSSFKDSLDNVKYIITALGLGGSYALGMSMSGPDIKQVLVTVAGILTTIVVTTMIENKSRA